MLCHKGANSSDIPYLYLPMMLSKGVRYMLLSSFLFTCMNVLVKLVPHIPALEIVFFRSLISLIISYAIIKSKRIPLLGKRRFLLVARGLTGAVGLIFNYILLQQIPLATAVTLQFLAPIMTAILGMWLLREQVRVLQWFFFLLSFGGILLVNGFDPRMELIHVLMGLLAALGAGMAYTIIRKLNTTEHPLVIVMYFPLVTMPLTGLYCLFFWQMPQGVEWLILLGIGVLTQFAQYYLTKAFQAEEINKVASLNYLSIVYALFFGFVFFGETFHLYTYLGMLLVVAGVVLNIWYKQRISKKQNKLISDV